MTHASPSEAIAAGDCPMCLGGGETWQLLPAGVLPGGLPTEGWGLASCTGCDGTGLLADYLARACTDPDCPDHHPKEETPAMKPTIGRIVIYRSKIDNGPGNDVLSPAIIIRTRDTTVPAVIDRWGPEPRTVVSASDPSVTHETTARPESVVGELADDDTVDLAVFGLGRTYREYSVSRGDGLGEWNWPQREDTGGSGVEVRHEGGSRQL